MRRSRPTLEHQSVSVGHYLLHPNKREFSQGTWPALANHWLAALLLTPDLSTHTKFRPYISGETSINFFFPFKNLPRDSVETITVFKCETEPWIFPKWFRETALVQITTKAALVWALKWGQTRAEACWDCALCALYFKACVDIVDFRSIAMSACLQWASLKAHTSKLT